MSNLFDVRVGGDGREEFIPFVATDIDVLDEPSESDVAIEELERAFTLRPYQEEAVTRIYEEWQAARSTLLVIPTGVGKTVVAAEVIRRRPPGRVMFVAHRGELISQGKGTIEAVTGAIADVEMAGRYAGGSDIIVATVQTLCSGMGGDGRMIAFKPEQFSLLILDESHHATSSTWRKVKEYFCQNPALKVLGLTATPDRADEEALGQIFDTVAFDYELSDAIKDGWLVPIFVQSVAVAGLDYSSIRTTAGDLNGADLAEVMEFEENLHRIASPTMEIVGNHKALVFAVTVNHAERLCEIFNRHKDGCARWVCGKTPKDVRAETLADFKRGAFSIIVNVGCLTEGFDEPSIEYVVMARPTKSRALAAQMIGRGTRALPGIVDGPPTAEERKAAIAASAKPKLHVIDFTGNTGRHRLVTPADILGGNYDDDVIDRANQIAADGDGKPVDVAESLEEAQRQIDEQKKRDAARRAALKIKANWTTSGPLNPFEMFGVTKYRERGWEKGKEISGKMQAALERQKLWRPDMDYSTARQLLQGMAKRREQGLCTWRQAQALAKRGLPGDVPFAVAGRWMDAIAANGWQVPQSVKAEAAQLVGHE